MVAKNRLVQLSYALISLYPSRSDARALVGKTNIQTGNIELDGPPRVYFWNIVQEAQNVGMLGSLIAAALEDYPDHPDLLGPLNDEYSNLTDPITSPGLTDSDWRPKIGSTQVEKLMGEVPTFLPVSFLEVGMMHSRSVARVYLPDGTGTGFLTAGNMLVTNNHVIPNVATARSAKIQFNYQETASGRPSPITEFDLDPDGGFTTSPMVGGHDFTIVRVNGQPSEEWGQLPIATRPAQPGDRVMIVQHPEGGFKKIALHNNIVTYADDNVLQYLTDTMPGSSGSPVFNHAWHVVGLHHAGGDLVEPGTARDVFRNQGINIGHITAALTSLLD